MVKACQVETVGRVDLWVRMPFHIPIVIIQRSHSQARHGPYTSMFNYMATILTGGGDVKHLIR